MKIEDLKNTFELTLKDTGRAGIEDLLEYLEKSGFYEAPCSGSYHLAEEGGLLRHSIHVLATARDLYTQLGGSLFGVDWHSLSICALLHDVGKMGQYGKQNYVANVLKSGKVSDSKPYVTNSDLLPVDHEIRSIAIVSHFISLTEDEQFAILYHNGMYGNLRYSLSGKETPLYMIIHWADMWASRVLEVKEEGE